MKALLCALLVFVLYEHSYGQFPSCKTYDFKMQDKFNMSAFEGHWYVISSKRPGSVFWNAIAGEIMNLQLHYTMLEFGRLEVMAGRSSGPMYGCFYSIHSAVPVPGSNLTKFDYLHTQYKLPGDSLWIVRTNYDGFAVTYGCDEVLPESGYCDPSKEAVYTLNRKKTGHTAEELVQVEDALNSICVSPRTLKPMKQAGECSFDPEQFPPPPPVTPSPAPNTKPNNNNWVSLLMNLFPALNGTGSQALPMAQQPAGLPFNISAFIPNIPQPLQNGAAAHWRQWMNLMGK